MERASEGIADGVPDANTSTGWRTASAVLPFAAGAALALTPSLAFAATEAGPWQTPALVASLVVGLGLGAGAALGWRSHRRHNALSAPMEAGSASTWRLLKQENLIDGHALWNAEDQLVDHYGFLSRYLPQLKDWRHPTGHQLVTALVESGQVLASPGMDREQTIEALNRLRVQVPGLRELRMADGQVYMARTVELGDSGRATIFSNITEFTQLQNAHRLHEHAFRDAFDSSPLLQALHDADKRPLAVNRAFTAKLGRGLDELAELGWQGLLHPEDASLAWTAGTRRFMAADGTVMRGLVRITPVRDGEGEHGGRTLVTIEDITARFDAEERMRLQASVLEQIGAAVVAVDRQGRVVYGNPAAQALFQWSDAMLPGTPVERLLGAHARAALDTDKTEIEAEGATWSGDGFPAQVGISHSLDANGQPAGATLVVADLTQRRALDLQLMHSARLATLGEMAASIAHEFNQCLHVIRLASEALRLDLGDGKLEPAKVGKRADNILTQVDRLTEMVTHMRTISRRDGTGKRPFRPQTALDAALRMVEPLLSADGIALVRKGRLGHANVVGHLVRLEQVLLNLLNNARDSIRDRCQKEGKTGGTITVTCEVNAARMRLSIADDGIGVDDDAAHHIFEPFFTTKESDRGCGLGLSISRGICGEMGGSLTFRNLEQGAEFTIDLPLLTAAEAETLPPAEPEPAPELDDEDEDEDPGFERRILLVDDEALSVMMVSEYLERQGYVVDTAYDGLEALSKCETHVYHAVITDIRMPRMDGHELIARLEDLQPGTPVIVVTGHLRDTPASELGANVVAMLSKPFQLQALRDHLHSLEHPAEPNRHNQTQQEGV